jgi:tRNA pseudouridine32 synthase / 23S rRNA pseudouridine746 synthase
VKTAIPILFENDDVIAVNKPEGSPTIPGRGDIGESLHSMLSAASPEKLYIVHRLDRETSGVVLFAKNAGAHRFLNERFGLREVKKTYLALVHGALHNDHGTIESPLREFASGRTGVDAVRGKQSETAYRVIERMDAFTLLEAFPLTGRRHQIRVHLYSIGHPVAGDRRYGKKNSAPGFPRLMLHAREITFPLPAGSEVTVSAPLPQSFSSVCTVIRAGSL